MLTVAMAATSLMRPIRARPTTYSTSRSGVVITLRMLRVHVSSMNPVATAIWLWKRTWKSMMPASRYGVAAWLVSFCCATNAPREPHSSTSNTGQKAMSNQRCGLRKST